MQWRYTKGNACCLPVVQQGPLPSSRQSQPVQHDLWAWTMWAKGPPGVGAILHHRQSPPAMKLVSADEKDIYLEILAMKNYSFTRKPLVCKLRFLFWELIGLATTIKQKYQVMTLLLILMLAIWPLHLLTDVLLVPEQRQAQSRAQEKSANLTNTKCEGKDLHCII